jgi:hypothetical protein
MGAGELQVGGAADALMEADFSYNVADWKPEVDYDVSSNNRRAGFVTMGGPPGKG